MPLNHTPFSVRLKMFIAIFFLAMIGVVIWQKQYPDAVVELKGERLHVLVADTPARQYRGLGKRAALAPYEGMLFLFGESERHGFVMRDMRFSIDIVWFQDGVVVDIAPSVPLDITSEANLRRYYPRLPSNIVLELPADWAAAHDLRIGDRLSGVDE